MESDEKESFRRLSSLRETREAAVAVAVLAKRELTLFTPDLEPLLYDQEEFLSIVRTLATRSRFSRIRVVCLDSGPSVRAQHRFIGLAQRFSSYIEVRRASRDHAGLTDTYLVADETALLYRPLYSRYEGYADLNAPMEARQRLRGFEDVWQQAEPDPEFRRLGI
ncbi:MAG TPA: hypothetical protein VGS99_01445 [Gammaproteobacteria bacterium]|nr:hypothetical protein [Gammaproteobacteria bacterium]HEV2333648.1 hypothetical protein [Gammaproteobacteria bacterium]